MSRPYLLLVAGLMSACGDEDAAPEVPADCTREEAVLLVPGSFEWDVKIRRAGDTTYFALRDRDLRASTYAGQACGAEPMLIAEGARMLPTRIALDPHDDDPTLVCDDDSDRAFRIDLTGERGPELLLPYLDCHGRPTAYGALFTGGWGYLRLFADFPDEASMTVVGEGGSDILVLDEWAIYTDSKGIHAHALATGEVTDVPAHVLGLTGRGDYVLWFDYEDIATVTLVDLKRNTSSFVGTFDRDGAWEVEQYVDGFPFWTWGFDPDGAYVYHLLPGANEAFDLAGRPVAFPLPGAALELIGGGVVSVDEDDGQLYFARPHDPTSTMLDAKVVLEDRRWSVRQFDGHLDQFVDGELLRIDLDGAPARRLASDVGRRYEWLDARNLVTVHDDGELLRIDTETGERVTLADHSNVIQVHDGALYFTRSGNPDPADDGLWYLSREALGPAEGVL